MISSMAEIDIATGQQETVAFPFLGVNLPKVLNLS